MFTAQLIDKYSPITVPHYVTAEAEQSCSPRPFKGSCRLRWCTTYVHT